MTLYTSFPGKVTEPLTSFRPKLVSYFKTEVILIDHKFCGNTYIDPLSY